MLRMFLAVTTVALAVWAGRRGTTEPTPTATPTPSPTLTCPPVLPITANVAGITTTSVTISYSIFLRPPCGYDPPMTVSLFASREDAQQWRTPVAVAVSGPERYGSVTVDRLTPDTEYWYRLTDVDGRRRPVRDRVGADRLADLLPRHGHDRRPLGQRLRRHGHGPQHRDAAAGPVARLLAVVR